MENRVRDLEQLEERDPDDRGRRVGTVIMATLGMVGLTFAIGVVVGKAAEPRESKKDPLDQLDRIALAGSAQAKPSDKAGKNDPSAAVPTVDATELTFAKSLTEEEDRPEVLAALEAAAQEEASLTIEEPSAEPEPERAQPASAPAEPANAEDQAETATAQPPSALPAAVAAGSSGQKLAQAAKHDRLVARALPSGDEVERAPHGAEGEFTLQVISYDAPAPAQEFARNLRAKGHEAFVATADLPERGRYYRVRIGPFKTRERAETYRRKFETDEHMNTIVVKRPKD